MCVEEREEGRKLQLCEVGRRRLGRQQNEGVRNRGEAIGTAVGQEPAIRINAKGIQDDGRKESETVPPGAVEGG